MASAPPSGIPHRIVDTLASGFAAPIAVIGLLGLFIARGAYLLPGGYDGSRGLNASLGVLLVVWTIGFAGRCLQPESRLAAAIEALSLFFLLSSFTALAAAASAVGSGAYVDPLLDSIDKALLPFFDWVAVATALPRYPQLYLALNHIYVALNWQPFLLIALLLVFGKVRDQVRFITAWALGLLLCVIPFHWLPALSPYGYYGISQASMPGNRVGLPWESVSIIEGLRHGQIQALQLECLSGLITIPSFHACGATILAMTFWRFRLLRWPFALLNLAMALVAVPIGSHYVVDIVAGALVGWLAVKGATLLDRQPRPGSLARSIEQPLEPVAGVVGR